ncbi:alpha/beta hydrolase [Nocardia panacis]|uniref:Alpha/beta hydrolase n=1 Tax=Nocardia panacis TaxID=2340916 RepID=A0A3A4JTI4_9NOCA|nr:alpha/beta hydrolase [Nocardia panacis]RJO73316.1 alpha/beta hydrolase [Nocardia panacis]
MTETSAAPIESDVLEVPGARLYYELRGSGPLIALVGAPMTAEPFAALADLLAVDHTVLTLDPRGHGRSVVADPTQDSTPQRRADDLARLITHLRLGPAVVLGSSGGAVTALALVEADANLATTVIAHEPPLLQLLDDRTEQLATTKEIIATYDAEGPLAGGRKFMALTGMAIPEEMMRQMYAPDRTPAELASEKYFYHHEMPCTVDWRPDFDRLRTAPTRLLVGIGDASTGQLCDRTSRALTGGLGLTPTRFPGGHGGFAEDPIAFHRRLREVLTSPR